MAEVTQYNFNFVELTEALIQRQGLHKGEWIVGVELNITVGILGANLETSRPGAMLLANQVQLMKAIPGQHPPHLIVDAAVVNPARSAKEAKRTRKTK
jgi:hypothetical protein